MSVRWMFRSAWIVVGVAIVAVLAVGFTQKLTGEPKTSDKSTSLNPGDAYRACVKDAADNLYSMIPDITRAQAIEQASNSPRCSPLK